MTLSFAARLHSTLSQGNLTVADLSRWFDRPHPTVRGWIKNGFDPRGGPHDVAHVHALLEALETLIRKRRDLPLKRGISRATRIAHIEGLRRDIDRRISQKGASR
jgi:hypothetical protein